MKPLLFCIFLTMVCIPNLQAQRKGLDLSLTIPKSLGKTFDFILKLDSLNYRSGKVHLNYKHSSVGKGTDVKARFRRISDSSCFVKINGQHYLMDTRTGKAIHSKTGEIGYRNHRLKDLEIEKAAIHGTDSLGAFTMYFRNFRKDVPSTIEYVPKPYGSNQTIQYTIQCTTTDRDSTWIRKDTIQLIKKYNENGVLVSEWKKRTCEFYSPEITESFYSYSGDTIIKDTKYLEHSKYLRNPETIFSHPTPSKSITKSFHQTRNNEIHSFVSFESDNKERSVLHIRENWEFGRHTGYFNHKEFIWTTYDSGETVFNTETTTIRISGKRSNTVN